MPNANKKDSKSAKPTKWYGQLNRDAINDAFENATVDAKDEEEQLSGLFYAIAEDMAFPWQASVLGDTVSVVGAEWPDDDRHGIDLVVEQNGKQSQIEARSVEMLPPYPEGHLSLAAYLLWKERV